jgi:uncharacterized pyridoxal phosphate-containing UPF0001 family protein
VEKFFELAKNFKNVKLNGLMTIGPLTDDKKKIKEAFLKLKEKFDKLKERYEIKYLSMGMSDDYDIAIECGSNMLRIGRKIFGERSQL